MKIGPEQWRWVTIDSVGVPRGGIYGRPHQIAKKLSRFGIFLAWSQIAHCFDVYTHNAGGPIIHQFRCRKMGNLEPIVLSDELAELLITLQAECPSGETLATRLLKQQQEVDMEEAHKRAVEAQDMESAVMRMSALDMGVVTANTQIIVPEMN